VYVGTAYRDEDEPAFVGAMSSVYVREGEDWRLALYEQTRYPTRQDKSKRPPIWRFASKPPDVLAARRRQYP